MGQSAAAASGFHGLRVAAFESRLADAMRALITRQGGIPLVTPALREIPLAENHEALAFADALFAGRIDLLICLTGVGTRTLAAAVGTRHPLDRFREALQRITIVARGPKPIKALAELGLHQVLAVPEPNTWHELLATLDRHAPVAGRRVAVQEYGVSNRPLLEALTARGAQVTRVPVYQWAMPQDTAPLRTAIHTLTQGQMDVILFTNAAQVEHLHELAEAGGGAGPLRSALGQMVVGSIGPIASETLRRYGYPVDLEPSHPKMGILVTETAAAAHALLAQKRPPPSPIT